MSVKQKKKQSAGAKGRHGAVIYLDRSGNSLDDARRCDFGCWRCDPEILWSYLLLGQTDAFIHCTIHHIIYYADHCIINTLFTD